jgi:isocitrate dehydrogenase kinase/phosphatase
MRHPESGGYRVVGVTKQGRVVFQNSAGIKYCTGERIEGLDLSELDDEELAAVGMEVPQSNAE